ncbi:molybdenum cofactor biosynthesis protein MoaA [Bacillus sp. JCM 19046]|uniref:GTP 3',8-cyclase n=1 Tax=Shouchella xiaoxiensis TaxID=766895 RepID=A0ABS2T019_9BACI|nr:cyclic pyranopterin phosphate synthase [Shouchella xiaoxiensis]GAF17541.1 molybdenum cofactor biosynthesis protein MoaA [Bacillus sp. JCM 19046]
MTNEIIYDRLSRPLRDLRISVMDRCNFRCSYCMPKEIFGKDYVFMKENELLTFEEIFRVAKQVASLGVNKLRITGGEPLLRKNVDLLVKDLYTIDGITDIALTTNGVLLPKFATALKAAGLDRVNVSLDALNPLVFQEMSGRNTTAETVLKGIEAAQEAGLGVKVNMVVKRGVNEEEVVPLARYCKDHNIPLRFIEFMDVGQTNGWNYSKVVSKKELYKQVETIAPLEAVEENYFGEVASRYRYQDSLAEVGFISSVTETFCGTCTRARISADGKLFTCLFSESGTDFKTDLRTGISDKALKAKLTSVWEQRSDRYSELRTEESSKLRKKIEMSYIGG